MRFPPPGGVCTQTHRMEHPWWHSCWSNRRLSSIWLRAILLWVAPRRFGTPRGGKLTLKKLACLRCIFRQGPLGHAGDKPTTVGTNSPDLRDLQGLQGEVSPACCSADSRISPAWAPGLLSHRVRTPTLAMLPPNEAHPSGLGTACCEQSCAIPPRLRSLRARCRERPPPPRCSSPGRVLSVLHVSRHCGAHPCEGQRPRKP